MLEHYNLPHIWYWLYKMKLVAILHTLLIGTTFIPKTGLPHSSQTVLTLLSDFAASYPALSGFETQILHSLGALPFSESGTISITDVPSVLFSVTLDVLLAVHSFLIH